MKAVDLPLGGKDLRRARKDARYLPDARSALLLDANPLAGLSLLLMLVVLVSGLLWADSAVLDIVTRGTGKVIPSSREQVIQSLEGGILAELYVREGDVVETGDRLLRIDDTRSAASYQEGEAKRQALRAAIARLQAEAAGKAPAFPADLPAELVASERKLYQSRRKALEEGLAGLNRSLALARQELELTEPLVEQGVASRVELLRLRREVNDLRVQIRDRRNAFRAEARKELSAREAELARVEALNRARADQVRRTVIRSPVRGTVKNIRVTTLGGVIQPGQEIMQIVPLEDRLLIEARIRPPDIAFIHPGQKATVKITAYDFSIYGGLEGVVKHISADTIQDERNPKESYYRVLIRTDKAHLEGREGPLPIIPGMTATVEILTGHKSVLEYLLKPVIKTFDNALHER